MKVRKKPVVVDAWEVTDISLKGVASMHRTYGIPMFNVGSRNGKSGIIIPTLEGDHLAELGDYIIKGIAGEYYPCKPDIFNKTYEIVD